MAQHLFSTFFKDVPNPLVRHHLESFEDLLQNKIPNYIRGSNPQSVIVDERRIDVYIGGKEGKVVYKSPIDDSGFVILPHLCRLENLTYKFSIYADIEIEYILEDKVLSRTFKNILIGELPLMLKSSLCHLSKLNSDELYDVGECRKELGGYFIIDGQERALLTQERLSDNMFYSRKRAIVKNQAPPRSTREAAEEVELKGTEAVEHEFISAIKSVSEDGTKGPYSHFLVIPPPNIKPDDVGKETDYGEFSTRRLATITISPGFSQPVPLFSIFYGLGIITDRDLYDVIFCGVPESERSYYDTLFAELILSHEKFIEKERAKMLAEDPEAVNQDPNLLVLRQQTRTRSNGGVFVNLYEMFPHCEPVESEGNSLFYRRKAYLLGHMTKMAMDVALDIKKPTDREHYRFKRLDASGDLVFQEFRRIYRLVSQTMKLLLDTRVHYEQQAYSGEKIVNLVQVELITTKYWKNKQFMEEILKSFKGKWDGNDGVSQVLTRFSYPGTISHLRRVNVQLDKNSKIIESRRIHGTSWGLLCPVDNPDGGNIGLIKSLAILCNLSTGYKTSELKKHLEYKPITTIHPSKWDMSWTKLFLNSELLGAVRDTENFHSNLLKLRRSRTISGDVSLCWDRLNNEYWIATDSSRPMRPVYQEGITEQMILAAKSWESITKYLDHIDAQETESLRISMTSFSPTKLSEIHGMALLSATGSINPNSDHNAGVRNAFSCSQIKHACSWFNTAFNKRYDTIMTWLNQPQKPITQTWTYPYIMGGIPYGENIIVALQIYTGYNQEDSILLNENSLQRGMFHTTYYHSYIVEETGNINFDNGQQSVTNTSYIGNPATDPKYRETVVRKMQYNYENLDEEGIIRVGSKVTPDTVLVGILVPQFNEVGLITEFRDNSEMPNRGQTGYIDGVYRYTTAEGLRAVKIRVAEMRVPIPADKFCARHGQKGTVGLNIPEEDMPFTASGLRPDMIVNPHAFPSRMTIGMFIEMLAAKVGVHVGSIMDATPFTTQNQVGQLADLLKKCGMHSRGHEILYNGMNGEMIQSEIFMAPTYYMRLKLMVADKINYRNTGPMKLLTHQPVEGRANDGGLRIGEMERDCLLSHGISKFIAESMMERSDKSTTIYNPEIGKFDVAENQEKLFIPYCAGLFVHQLQAMHVSTQIVAEN